eukprot:gene5567-4202_t
MQSLGGMLPTQRGAGTWSQTRSPGQAPTPCTSVFLVSPTARPTSFSTPQCTYGALGGCPHPKGSRPHAWGALVASSSSSSSSPKTSTTSADATSSAAESLSASVAPSAREALLNGPTPDFDFRATVAADTRRVVSEKYPELMDLVEDVVYRRPADYVERRDDGYQEPELIFLVGTAHVSQQSVSDVERVISAVKPESVVVELCKSRMSLIVSPPSE